MPGINAMDFQAIGGDIVGAEDIVGADDESVAELLGIMGDDDDDDFDIGAKAKARKMVNRIALARKAAKMGLGTVNVQPNSGRFLAAGGSATQGAATGSLDVTVTLQERFRPQRLIIAYLSDAGAVQSLAGLVITDILCGTRSQLTSLGNVSALAFSDVATNQTAGLMFDTIGPGTSFTVRFQSVTALYRVIVTVMGAAMR